MPCRFLPAFDASAAEPVINQWIRQYPIAKKNLFTHYHCEMK
jgi:hypothetical protein